MRVGWSVVPTGRKYVKSFDFASVLSNSENTRVEVKVSTFGAHSP